MNPILHDLHNKQWVWTAANAKQQQKQKRISGFNNLDKVLSGGFPLAGTIHLQSPLGCGELRFMLSILQQQRVQQQKQCSEQRAEDNTEQSPQKLYIFINPPFELNAEFLLAHKVALNQLVIVQAKTSAEALWTAEQSVKSGACDAVFIWQNQLKHTQIRKLELAAQQGQSYCVWLQSALNQNQQASIQSNLPLSLSLCLSRKGENLEVTVNKQKIGWAQGPVKVALPFKSRIKTRFTQQSIPATHNVIALHSSKR